MNKTALIILDGWGQGKADHTDAVAQASTPCMDGLMSKCPNATLVTFGEAVGLPEGQMGNSEVGHMNIGAGRIVYQDLVRINREVSEGGLFRNRTLLDAVDGAGDGAIHLMGLLGEGGVHASQSHLHALIELVASRSRNRLFIHGFTDGRDADPKAGLHDIERLEAHLKTHGGVLASVVGRYYAMDRDKRWERIARAYDLLVHRKGDVWTSAREGVEAAYAAGQTDEFIEPIVVQMTDGAPDARIKAGDTVICFNFRTDRCREITMALTQSAYPEFGMNPLPLRYYTMTRYDATFKNVGVAYEKDDLSMTLGQVVSQAGGTQLRMAETEKYPHVTFFFSGGREAVFEGETRLMVSSPKVATYDLQPEMSAFEVAEKAVEYLKKEHPDLVVINFANPDMVGHTGVFSAIVKAVETTDACLQRILEVGKALDYRFVIIADHGNADCAINDDGSKNTAHTVNPVPIVVVDPRVKKLASGILADVAPTVLALMGVEPPKEMTGKQLVEFSGS